MYRKTGQELENSILYSTWSLIQNIGYNKMTMNDIAKRAKTNKAAIYRRWNSKFRVTIDTIIKIFKQENVFNQMQLPNTGDLHDDLIQLMQMPCSIFNLLDLNNVRAILLDGILTESFNIHERFINLSNKNIFQNLLIKILNQAYQRKEIQINPINLDKEIINLPIMLIISQIFTNDDYNKKMIDHLVDNILLPVLFK